MTQKTESTPPPPEPPRHLAETEQAGAARAGSAPAGRHALVLFSGGQDSTTCVAWALQRFAKVSTVGFDYGQRHRVELDQRGPVLAGLRAIDPEWNARLQDDHVLALPTLAQIGGTAMIEARQIEFDANGLPNTFVPGRNLMFLLLASALGVRIGADIVVGGMCETDFSGYPDCRDDTVKATQVAVSLGLGRSMRFETPLMWLDKAQTWALAEQCGGRALVELIVERTHTCYLGERGAPHAWGHGCGECPACVLRARGWHEWQGRLRGNDTRGGMTLGGNDARRGDDRRGDIHAGR